MPEEFTEYCSQHDVLPVEVIVANILAKPLIGLAPYFATLIAPKGRIVLAGLIESQTEQVILHWILSMLLLRKKTNIGSVYQVHLPASNI